MTISTYSMILLYIYMCVPSHARLAYHTVQLGLFWMLLTDVADISPRVVRHKPRFVDGDGPTGLALVRLGRRDLDEGGDGG